MQRQYKYSNGTLVQRALKISTYLGPSDTVCHGGIWAEGLRGTYHISCADSGSVGCLQRPRKHCQAPSCAGPPQAGKAYPAWVAEFS